MKIVIFAAVLACLAATAGAQTQAPSPVETPLPEVDDMTCEQMQAEMTIAGQLMSQRMDPNLGTDLQAMQADSQRQMGQAGAAGIGTGLLCAVPGLGGACTAVLNTQAARQAEQAEQNRERRGAMIDSMQNATSGIDMERMTAVSQRWESERCETPQP